MDSITHGIAGALAGKALFAGSGPPDSERTAQSRRVAIFAATLGSVFPDSDILIALFDRGHGAGLEIHRGVTHSLICLPVFAVLLALATRWYTRHRFISAPSFGLLTLIYATGLGLHIFLDLVTSYGTMIWSPLSRTRAAWDFTFIIDLTVSGIVLLPQLAARSYRTPGTGRLLRIAAWVVGSLLAFIEYGFSWWVLGGAALFLSLLLFAPAVSGWGYRVRRESWCRAGLAVFVLYMGSQGVAHYIALSRVRQFAASRALAVESLGALPSIPSLLGWNGLIRTPTGVYVSAFRLGQTPNFEFIPDSPDNSYIEAAKQAPSAKRFLWFARFPTVAYRQDGDLHTVDFSDVRFAPFRQRNRHVRARFGVRVTLDSRGKIVREEWPAE